MGHKIDLSIVIVNYNTLQDLQACVHSIRNSIQEHTYEIIIVDNASRRVPRESDFDNTDELSIHRQELNTGFARGCNLGMSMSRGNNILLLNPDTVILGDAIDRCLLILDKSGDISITSASLINHEGTVIKNYWYSNKETIRSLMKKAMAFNALMGKYYSMRAGNNKKDDTNSIGGLYGAMILLRREVYEVTKGFDPDFFMYSEDIEWFRNRIKGKYRICITPDAKVMHLGGKSSKDESWKSKQKILSYYLYWYKIGKLHFALFYVTSLFATILNLFIFPFLKSESRGWYMNVFHVLPLVLIEILKYSNRFGARENALIYK